MSEHDNAGEEILGDDVSLSSQEKKRKFTISSPGMTLPRESLVVQQATLGEEDEDESGESVGSDNDDDDNNDNENEESSQSGISSDSDEENIYVNDKDDDNDLAKLDSSAPLSPQDLKKREEEEIWRRTVERHETATKIQKMFRARCAWKLFRFIVAIPDLYGKQKQALCNRIQKNWRGYWGRKFVKYLRGDYVNKPSLRMRIKEKGGEYRFLSYVYKVEDERDNLLMEVAKLKNELLLTTTSVNVQSPDPTTRKSEFIRSKSQANISLESPGSKRWMLHRKVEKSKSWAEVTLSDLALRRLDAIMSTSLVVKEKNAINETKKKLRQEKKEKLQLKAAKEEELLYRASFKTSPLKDITRIEGLRGLVDDIEIEEEREKNGEVGGESDGESDGEGGMQTISTAATNPEVNEEEVMQVDGNEDVDLEVGKGLGLGRGTGEVISPVDPDITKNAPKNTLFLEQPQQKSPIKAEPSKKVDIVSQWRLKRGYG